MQAIVSTVRRLRKSRSIWLLGSQVGCEALTLLRSIFLARMLGPNEIGIVAILTLALRLVEMLSDMASDRLLVQAKDGGRQTFQATTQSVLVIRGIVAGLGMAALSIPLSWLLGLPDLMASIAVLGLVPALRGFIHLDYRRWQRVVDFRPQFKVEIGASIAFTLVAFLTSCVTQSYFAIIAGGLAQALTMVVISHAISKRPYRLAWDRSIARRLIRFGTPMIVNGVVLFVVFQSDRLIVSYFCSLADLGRYALAFQLVFTAGLVIARVITGLELPRFAKLQNSPSKLAAHYRKSLGIILQVAVMYTALFTVWGNDLIRLFYGESFVLESVLITWIAMAQGVRVLRALPSVTALAFADSKSPLIANILRIVGVVGAAIAGGLGFGLQGMVIAGLLGELCAYATSVVLLRLRYQIPVSPACRDISLFLIGSWLVSWINESHSGEWIFKATLTSGGLVFCGAWFWISQHGLSRSVQGILCVNWVRLAFNSFGKKQNIPPSLTSTENMP